jgi:lipopolysaccharide/colanic/teichoic acid biosynthesis glycosyltransferase
LSRYGIGTGQRLFDVALAAAGLIVLVPLMLLIALAIYIDSGWPILFSQIRLGQHGHHFGLRKFRKFYRVSAAAGNRALTLSNDNRMTRVGRLLARTKLDELPQLWNVLAGDMSIVGPRPESLAFADCFDERYRAVLDFRPGIFGPNQVFFRSEGRLYTGVGDPEAFYRRVLFPLKARADLAYFPHRTFRHDLAWISRGVCAIFGYQFSRHHGCDPITAVTAWIGQNTRG